MTVWVEVFTGGEPLGVTPFVVAEAGGYMAADGMYGVWDYCEQEFPGMSDEDTGHPMYNSLEAAILAGLEKGKHTGVHEVFRWVVVEDPSR